MCDGERMADASADASADGVSVSHRPFARTEGDALTLALFGGGEDGELQPKVPMLACGLTRAAAASRIVQVWL